MPADLNETELAGRLRANIVFETMLASVVYVAAAGGAVYFAAGAFWRFGASAFSAGSLFNALYDAAAFTFTFFLSGFAFSLAIGIPVFHLSEKMKLRAAWPYFAASFGASFVFLALLGRTPSIEAPLNTLYLIAPIAATILFARKMKPIWRAAEKSETTNIIRLH